MKESKIRALKLIARLLCWCVGGSIIGISFALPNSFSAELLCAVGFTLVAAGFCAYE